MFELRRRAFIAPLGATMAGWPLRARSQQGGRARMGVLIGLAEGDPEIGKHLSAFRGGLRALGWTDGQNVQIDHRVAGDDIDGVFAAMAEGPPGGVIVMTNVFTAANRDRILAQAERFRIPTVCPRVRAAACCSLTSALARSGLVRFTSRAMTVAVGISWCSSSSRFGPTAR